MRVVGNDYFHIPYLANYSPPVCKAGIFILYYDMRVERKICNLHLKIILICFWSKKQLFDYGAVYSTSISLKFVNKAH